MEYMRVLPNRYRIFNMTHPALQGKKPGWTGSTCSFNAGVMVVDVPAWRAAGITQELLHWLDANSKSVLYVRGGSQPPMLLAFYGR